MFLQSIHRAAPPTALTQRECWQALNEHGAVDPLSDTSKSLLRKVLLGDSGIRKRHFANADPRTLFTLDAEALNRSFEKAAPALASEALAGALEKAGLRPADLDAVFVCTCTGYLCPGLSSHVAEHLGVGRHAFLQDLVGLGCGAAIPLLRTASHFATAESGRRDPKVACVAVEICSAAFYLDNDPGVLISACLFADGACATIWSGRSPGTGFRVGEFDTLHQPEHREHIRFTNAGGKLRNQLRKTVPHLAAEAVAALHARSACNGSTALAVHSAGRDVLECLAARLPDAGFAESHAVLRDYGNLSSPSVLFALDELLKRSAPPGDIWLTSFGAGFAAHACRLRREAS